MSVDPADEDGVGEGEDGEEDEVGTDPGLACGGGVGEEWRYQPEEEEREESEWDGEEEKAFKGSDPKVEGVGGAELITETAKAEEVAPGVKGDKVGADGEEGWGEVEKE